MGQRKGRGLGALLSVIDGAPPSGEEENRSRVAGEGQQKQQQHKKTQNQLFLSEDVYKCNK